MPIFEYKAYAEGGASRTGVIDADTPRDARQRLRRDKLLVSELREVKKRGVRKGPQAAKSKDSVSCVLATRHPAAMRRSRTQ